MKIHIIVLFFLSSSMGLFAQPKKNNFYNGISSLLNGKYETLISSKIGSEYESKVKIGLQKIINDNIVVDASYINYLNTYDYSFRTTILKNRLDASKIPIKLYYKTAIIVQSNREVIFGANDKLKFLHQFYINYNIRSSTIIILEPIFIHQNLEKTKLEPKGYPWDFFFVGLGINHKINTDFVITGQFFNQIINEKLTDKYLKYGYEINLKYIKKRMSYNFSLSNLGHLSNIGLLEDMGLKNVNSLKIGLQITHQLEINLKNEKD